MTTYPGGAYRPLEKTQGQPRMARHDVICLHTMVGTLTGTDRMFHANGWQGTESHFGIGGKWGDGRDGEVIQWQDTEFRADANLNGNHRVLSIETGDNAPRAAADIEPWTEKQLDAIVALVAWLCRTYDIPAELIPDSKPGRRGIGYHRLGVKHSGGTNPAGFLQPGGEVWSTSVGKECPGPARIAQVPGIVERVASVLKGPATKEDDMLDKTEFPKIAAAVWGYDHKLTAADAEAIGDPKREGQTAAMDALLRFAPAVARLRTELNIRDKDTAEKLGQLHDEMKVLQETMTAVLNALAVPQ